jgi:hypothetical protein
VQAIQWRLQLLRQGGDGPVAAFDPGSRFFGIGEIIDGADPLRQADG